MKPLRQHRKDILYHAGFLKFEAQALSKNRLNTPGMKALVQERRRLLKEDKKLFVKAVKAKPLRKGQDPIGTYYKLWDEKIKNLYDANNWYDNKGNRNPFARLREIVEEKEKSQPNWRDEYTGQATRKKKARVTPGEYRKRAAKTRTYMVTVTYEVAASSQKEAEEQTRRKLKNIQKIKVSDID